MITAKTIKDLKEAKKSRIYQKMIYSQEPMDLPIHRIENNERIIEKTNIVNIAQEKRFNPVARIDDNPIIKNIIENKQKVMKNK